MSFKDYRDPLYGFIGVNDKEQSIIDSTAFQRLRHIKQLGTTFLVYPTANHTRFEHSLGTMEVATRLFDHIVNTGGAIDLLGWTRDDVEYYRKLLRCAALLHDVGHPPLSHASESLLPEGRGHEEYTYRIILDPEYGYSVLDDELGTGGRQKVAEISTGTAKDKNGAFLSELLTGDLGADRLDYLIRDSYHLGVAYGKFDVQRLLNTFSLCYDEEKQGPALVIEEGGY